MLFYRSADLLITDQVVAHREARPARYRLDELGYVRVMVLGADPRPARLGRIATFVLAGVLAIWAWLSPSQTHVVAVVALCAAVGGACIRVPSQRRELWALYRRRNVCLFHTTDPERFGQVQRALLRALEHRQRRHEERGGWSEIERA
jgi:hypothetical protein